MLVDVSLKVRGLPALQDFFRDMPRNVRGIATEGASEYIIGDGDHGLKHYPAYKYVTRRSAFGRTFQSVAQQRYVMANIKSGRIDPGVPHRTGNYQRSWKREGAGVASRITGEVPHEGWPNPLAKRIGWRTPLEIVMTNIAGAIRHAEAKVAEWIRSKGYG